MKTILSQSDFDERIANAQALMAKTQWDAVLVFSTESEPAGVRYFADYWASFESCAVLIPRTGRAALIIGPESLTYATSRSRLPDIIQSMDFRESSQPDYPGAKHPSWRDILTRFGIESLGIAGWQMFPYPVMIHLADALGGMERIVPADELVRALTIRKSPREMDCLRRAAKISELGLAAVIESIQPGMTEAELCGIATAAMLAGGAEATGYPVWCCSGPHSNQAISRPSLRPVGAGEVIHFSIGAKVEGYSASIGRPIVLGHCPDSLREFMQTGLDAANLTFDRMRAGRLAGEVAREIHAFVRDRGYGDAILYGPAHGCGQMECEYPFLETSSGYTLEAGMTFMQDMFLQRGGIGFRWEDGLIVRENQPAEELSDYARRINIIGAKK